MLKKLLYKLGLNKYSKPWYIPNREAQDSSFDLNETENLYDQGKKFNSETDHSYDNEGENFLKEEAPLVTDKKKMKAQTLEVVFKNNTSITWTSEQSLKDKSFPFDNFYTWYLAKETPIYVFKDKEGEILLKREDIFIVKRKKLGIVENLE